MDRMNAGLPAVWSSVEWFTYFTRNSARQRVIPWELGASVSTAELTEIAASLRGWQLGETSDGAHLLAAALNYAAKVSDPDFPRVVELFIKEEQRHGGNLGRFLDLAGVPRAHTDWGDTLFRFVRYSFASMEVWATPVVMVETHAMIYYGAIRHATHSPVLRGICEQILADEVAHIRFQCERLAILHRRHARWLRMLILAVHRLMFAAISLAVWAGHRRALRAGGYPFARFWRAAWNRMRYAWRTMSPNSYRWEEQPSPSPARTPPIEARAAG
jgi:hypothetical protein